MARTKAPAAKMGMMGESFAWLRRASPIAWLAPHLRSRSVVATVFALAALFPIVHQNDADIDSAANALTFAALALGLNIVVGLPGLLDLGYAPFFAIGAYSHRAAASWQMTPEWTPLWEPCPRLGLVAFLILTSQRLKFSRIGRAWMAIREDEVAAAAMGVNRVKMKLLAFATGAAFAGATGTLFVAKLQTATPDMFGFPVSVMILVMIVFGGIGSVWGVVLGALILQILQSWFLVDLSQWLHALGRLVHVDWLQRVELASSIELIFGLILVTMMLYRRDGLIPATKRVAALTIEEQSAQVTPGRFDTLTPLPPLA